MPDRPPQLSPELVQDFVANAHGNLPRVRELLERHPSLANAAWDWGAGDWETGLGAAAHTGQRDIAHALLDAGARIDIFAAAMLGRLDVVRSILNAFPNVRTSNGPHGIPLIKHAEAGGPGAAAVVEFLHNLAAR